MGYKLAAQRYPKYPKISRSTAGWERKECQSQEGLEPWYMALSDLCRCKNAMDWLSLGILCVWPNFLSTTPLVAISATFPYKLKPGFQLSRVDKVMRSPMAAYSNICVNHTPFPAVCGPDFSVKTWVIWCTNWRHAPLFSELQFSLKEFVEIIEIHLVINSLLFISAWLYFAFCL